MNPHNSTVHNSTDKEKQRLLEKIYEKYHGLHYLHPDPLEFVYRYSTKEDREIVGLLAASLALGRVSSILSVLEWVVQRLTEPAEMCKRMDRGDFYRLFDGFVYRFYTTDMLAELLGGVGGCVRRFGSLEECFRAQKPEERGMQRALEGFYREIYKNAAPVPSAVGFPGRFASASAPAAQKRILPDPAASSACKRLHLYLRWMIRKDDVDPGCWEGFSTRLLLVPLDTHMLRFARAFGLTARKSGDIKTAIEVTKGLQKFDFFDPVRYDFSITRLGIHPEGNFGEIKTLIEGSEK